jgi:hypothetical protein
MWLGIFFMAALQAAVFRRSRVGLGLAAWACSSVMTTGNLRQSCGISGSGINPDRSPATSSPQGLSTFFGSIDLSQPHAARHR